MQNSESIQKDGKGKVCDILLVISKIACILSALGAFFAAFNPGKLCGLINKNASIFTIAVSYKTVTGWFGRALSKGWVAQSTITMLYCMCLVMLIGIVASIVGWCMSFGELRMKKVGLIITLAGSFASLAAMMLVFPIQSALWNTVKQTKVEPAFSPITVGFIFYAVVLGVIIVTSLVSLILLPKATEEDEFMMQPKFQLFLMMLPALVLVAVFSYLPLYGWRYAFFDYTPGKALTLDDFAGLKYFNMLVASSATRSDIIRVMRNTLAMSAFGIFGQWIPMAFAIFLSEIRSNWFRRIVQTFTTIPNFISWVLVYTVAFALFSSDGFVSVILLKLGIIKQGVNFLQNGDMMWLKMWLWGMWKGLGWSAIIYIAAISGIDQELYEAATVDGAGRFRKMWHITVPGLLPTFFVLLLLAVAGILSNGMDQYYVFRNAFNKEYLEVLDLYTYLLGLGSSNISTGIPLSTLVGMLKSIISVILLFGANAISKAIRGESIV